MRSDIDEEILSINKPALSFSKSYSFDNGSILTPSFGLSYNFSETPLYTEMLMMQPGVSPNMIEAILDSYNYQNINPNSQFPTNASNSLENMIGLTFLYPLAKSFQFLLQLTIFHLILPNLILNPEQIQFFWRVFCFHIHILNG